MKITYINEAVRLPSGQAKKVSLTDIQAANANYIKQQIRNIINEEFNSCSTKLFSALVSYFYCNYHDTLEKPTDFSMGMTIAEDDNHKYVVHLCTTLTNIWNKPDLLYAVDINNMLNDICARHSDIITDIKLNSGYNIYNMAEYNGDIGWTPYPTVKFIYNDIDGTNGTTKTGMQNSLQLFISSDITDEQLHNLTEYMLRFDNVTDEGVDCMFVSAKNSEYSLPNVVAVLLKFLNDVLPKLKFKFNKIMIHNELGINVDRIKPSDILQQQVFDSHALTRIAYDFDKFYVSLNPFVMHKYIELDNNTEIYMQDYSPIRMSFMCRIFRYISHFLVPTFNKNNIDIGYYPKLNKLCFIHTKGINLSFISIDEVLDFIIENAGAVNSSYVTNEDINNGLKKIFSIS